MQVTQEEIMNLAHQEGIYLSKPELLEIQRSVQDILDYASDLCIVMGEML